MGEIGKLVVSVSMGRLLKPILLFQLACISEESFDTQQSSFYRRLKLQSFLQM
jgi:hypothetical protein